jgi:hypothetical protein
MGPEKLQVNEGIIVMRVIAATFVVRSTADRSWRLWFGSG